MPRAVRAQSDPRPSPGIRRSIRARDPSALRARPRAALAKPRAAESRRLRTGQLARPLLQLPNNVDVADLAPGPRDLRPCRVAKFFIQESDARIVGNQE